MAKKSDAKKMNFLKTSKKESCECGSNQISCSGGDAIYGLGIVGSMIYYISTATSFWMGVLGVLKSIVWPVFIVFGLLKFLGG